MEVSQKRSERDVDLDIRMGGEKREDSGFLMEEDVEEDSGIGFKVDGSFAVSAGSAEHSGIEALDWSGTTGHTDVVLKIVGQKEGSKGGDGGSQTSEEGEAEADSGSTENEAEKRDEIDDQNEDVKEEEMEGSLDVCLWPVEEGGGHVRISLEEVERYYRFSRCCHWLCDEIMQLDSSPLRAADITSDLKKQFAILSGGRGDTGSPVIVFPEFPAFGEITNGEFHNVLTYLTSVPR
ncbi:hypothetical protein CesoFtcFv8_013689 [Champsocephalus esox]|uniref:Uncharacterized protein n=1 Tax=Champsocephalus esox TaxID=159716 RepID=A0AAN8BS17_9TELE|nr:hypothetical protein CesoFtcFv8_013689 [Champsocephalus esox]